MPLGDTVQFLWTTHLGQNRSAKTQQDTYVCIRHRSENATSILHSIPIVGPR